MRLLILFIVVTAAAIFAWWYTRYNWKKNNPCIRSHKEIVHRAGWVQMMLGVNGILIPIFHPAYDEEIDVCDERADLSTQYNSEV